MSAAILKQYAELKALAETMPSLETCNLFEPSVQQWLGRTYAAVEATIGGIDAINFRVAADNLNSVLRQSNSQTIRAVLHRALGVAESRLPEASASFIQAGDIFGAFVQIGKIFDEAKADVLVVDPYMHESVLTDYAVRLADGAKLRLLTTTKDARLLSKLVPAGQKWNATHPSRPVEIREAPMGLVHDRIIAVDRQTVWIVTQSLKALGAKAPATVTRFVDDLTPEKLAAYEAIWTNSTKKV